MKTKISLIAISVVALSTMSSAAFANSNSDRSGRNDNREQRQPVVSQQACNGEPFADRIGNQIARGFTGVATTGWGSGTTAASGVFTYTSPDTDGYRIDDSNADAQDNRGGNNDRNTIVNSIRGNRSKLKFATNSRNGHTR